MKGIYRSTTLLLALVAPIRVLAQQEVVVTTIVPVYVYISNGVEVPFTPSVTPIPTSTPAPAIAPVAAAAGDGAPVAKYVVHAETTSKVPPANGAVQIPSHTPTSALGPESAAGQTLPSASVPAAGVTPAPPPVADNGVMTISIVNKWPSPLSISYGDNAGSPNAIGPVSAGPLGKATTVVYPTGWAGRIYVGKTDNAANTKIEGSTTGANDIDISYVDGYSVPITCLAAGTAITGCNIDLWSSSGSCAHEVGDKEVCLNPMQGVADGPATPWFLPCQGAAYTFPNDNIANNGNTRTADITCCIGTAAHGCKDAPERQGKGNNRASKKRNLAEALLEDRAANAPSLLPREHSHLRRHALKARSHGHRLVRNVKDLV